MFYDFKGFVEEKLTRRRDHRGENGIVVVKRETKVSSFSHLFHDQKNGWLVGGELVES